MHKRLISFFLVFSLLLSLFSVSAFADDAHQHTFENKREYDLTNLPDGYQIPFTVYEAPCSGDCGYSEYSWNIFGISGKFVDKTGTPALTVYKHYREWFESTYGQNATAKKIDATNGGANIPAAGGRNPKGYGDEGKPNVNLSGASCIWVEPFGISNTGSQFHSSAPSRCVTGSSQTGTNWPISDFWICPEYYFTAPVSGLYFVGSYGSPYDFGTISFFYDNKWNLMHYAANFSEPYHFSVSLKKGESCWLGIYFSYPRNPVNYPYKFSLNKIPIYIEPLGDSSMTTTNNITINNNTWNGNIYTDNSTNLTYIYPQYTTINEKNETVTNISNTPIIYNQETKQYYTYDQTTKNYYYITYNAQPTPSPSPSPSESPAPAPTPDPGTTPTPTPKPGGGISTPETGKPDGGGDTNNFWNIFIGGGSDDGSDGDHKGIFWALVSLILALIAFFTNLFAGVAYLFPFLPEGVVMTINTCLFVVFLFVIIKFIMRSK